MAKVMFRILNELIRSRAINALRAAPLGSVLTIADETRTKEQNATWWPLLSEISIQAVHPATGQAMPPEWWRLTLLDALGLECPPSIPSLDGAREIPIGYSSSKLGKKDFSDLIELTYAVGAQLGVIFPTLSNQGRSGDVASAA